MAHREQRDPQGSTRLNWTLIWRQHGRWLKRVLRARLRSDDQVDDVFQEIALTVSRKPERWPQPDKIAPWLYRVTLQHVFLFRRRKHRGINDRESLDQQLEPLASIEEPVAILMSRESRQMVKRAMQRLGGQDREILILKHAENWTYEQISKHTGLSREKVVYRLGRARDRLRRTLCSLNQPCQS